MNTSATAAALQQLRSHYAQPVVLAALFSVALILGLSGPFHTLSTLSALPRFGYWGTIVVVTYGTGYFLARALAPRLRRCPAPVRVMLTAVVIACAVTTFLLMLNLAIGIAPKTTQESLLGFLVVLVICLVIESVGSIAHLTPHAVDTTPLILDRLAPDKRGELLALSVRDHYVDVVTTQGRDVVLMRLGDAIRETGPVAGVRVHRSHWVARDAIHRVRRTGETAIVTLPDHSDIPVSRTGLRALQDAGLLPARTQK